MQTVIDLLQLHSVVIDHAVGGDLAGCVVEDQIQCCLACIQSFQLLHGDAAAMQVHVVIPAYLLQVGKVCDDRGLLTAEGQVDEVGHIGSPQLIGHPLELCQLVVGKTVQPLNQVIQLVHIDLASLQTLENGNRTLEFFHRAVPRPRVPDVQCLQHLDGAVILIRRDGKGNGHKAIFYVACVIQGRSDLHVRSPFHSVFSFWCAYSHPRCPSRENRGPGKGIPHSGRTVGTLVFVPAPGYSRARS